MSDKKFNDKIPFERRINLNFLMKLNKTAAESFCTLTEVYGEHCVSHAHEILCVTRFCEGREDLQDDERSGRPCTVRMIAELGSIGKSDSSANLHENLNMTKVCDKVVPQRLRGSSHCALSKAVSGPKTNICA
uniref:Mos1 transposase HTH domain-containing protein n=1 Tax=Lates calcarifer TaxID=8187 RepID=A0A4W6G735_LATCA